MMMMPRCDPARVPLTPPPPSTHTHLRRRRRLHPPPFSASSSTLPPPSSTLLPPRCAAQVLAVYQYDVAIARAPLAGGLPPSLSSHASTTRSALPPGHEYQGPGSAAFAGQAEEMPPKHVCIAVLNKLAAKNRWVARRGVLVVWFWLCCAAVYRMHAAWCCIMRRTHLV